MFVSGNPYLNKTILEIPFDSSDILNNKKKKAVEAFHQWKITDFEQKSLAFEALSALLRQRKQYFATLITQEMGKPILQSLAEIEKCAYTIDWYCLHGKALLNDIAVTEIQGAYADIRFEPLGVVLGIMPWNFPFWQVFRYAIPTLLTGNVSLLKPAPNVPVCSRVMEELFLESGFPSGVFQCVFASIEDAGRLIESSDVHAITFTGSDTAGRSIASIAGKSLKKCVLELGGSDPFIVLKDADLAYTVQHAIKGRLQNNGQSCIASKRFIIEESIYEPFMQHLKEIVSALRFGDPMLETTDLGPLARPDLKDLLTKQVEASVAAGALIYYRHPFDDSNSNFFAPILLKDIPLNCPARNEELFGPVFACMKAKDETHAVKIANETRFGLGASIWTSNAIKANEMAQALEAGSVFINSITKSDPRLPFGGIKHSGYGRELSVYGMHEFANIKTYYLSTNK